LGFAIPSSTIQKLWPQLLKYGHARMPWLGVAVLTDTASLAHHYRLPAQQGVAIIYIIPHSAAAKAGFKAGEVITRINNHSVQSATQLENLINQDRVGQKITVSVKTHHGSITKSVILGEAPNGPISIPHPSF
jgi:S1-C subfamily serine protease